MKAKLLFFILFISTVNFAQEDAWVYFKDKPNASFYFANPLEMLSQRALDRRTTQRIELDVIDVPVEQTYIDQVILPLYPNIWGCLAVRGSFRRKNAGGSNGAN